MRKVLSNCRFSLMISSSRLNGTSVSVFLEEATSLIEMPTLSKNVYPMNGVFLPSNSFLPTPLVALDGKASTGIDISSSSSCTEKLEVSSGEANTGLNGGVAGNPNKEISRFQYRDFGYYVNALMTNAYILECDPNRCLQRMGGI